MTWEIKRVWGLLMLAAGMAGATPEQDRAFLKVWSAHQANPQDHAAVIVAAQSVMDKAITLGDYLPAVKTLAAWHLLAAGKRADAERVFESALLPGNGGTGIERAADQMARRWLSRLDAEDIVRSLKKYYADNVEYPPTLSPIFSSPAGRTLKAQDRFGDAWTYRIESFLKLAKAKNQRYALYSKSIGKPTGLLKNVPFTRYGNIQVLLQGVKRARPLTCEFATRPLGAQEIQTGLATEGGLVNGIRFLKLSTDQSFALMAEVENDYWCLASGRGNKN